MLNRRKVKLADPNKDTPPSDTPIPPKLKVKLNRVNLWPKQISELRQLPGDITRAIHWKWENWVDARGAEFASVKYGSEKLWYSVTRQHQDEMETKDGDSSVQNPDGSGGIDQLQDESCISSAGCCCHIPGTCWVSGQGIFYCSATKHEESHQCCEHSIDRASKCLTCPSA